MSLDHEPAYASPVAEQPSAGTATAITTTAMTATGAAPSRPTAPPGALWAVRLLGGSLALALVLLGGAAAAAGFFVQKQERHDTVPQGVRTVQVRGLSGDVSAKVGVPGSQVQVSRTVHWTFGKPGVSLDVVDGTARLTDTCAADIGPWGCSVDVDLVLPPGTALEVQLTSGNITLTGLDGTVTATSTTGNLTATGLGSSQVRLRTTTGDVTAAFTQAPSSVTLHTTTGDVDVALPTAAGGYRFSTQTATGSTQIEPEVGREPTSTRVVDLTTTTGDIRVHGNPLR